MGFDSEKFMSTKFQPREDSVPVPDLKSFFGKGEIAIWKIRGLTGIELARANEAAEVNKNLKAIIEGILSRQGKKKTEAIKELAGVSDNVPQDIAKRVEMLVIGGAQPKVDYPLATKFCESFPVEFYDVTNKISQITGAGHVPGKAPPSGKTKKSGKP